MRARRGRWAALLLAGVSGAAALGPMLLLTEQPAFAFAQKVELVNFAYNPNPAYIKPGDKIIWLNNSNTKHTVTSDPGSTSFDFTIAPGRTEELRFANAGTYTYHCKIHSQMTGTIEVSDTPPTSATAPPPTTTTTASTAPPTTTSTAPSTTTTAEPTTTTSAPRPAAGPGPVPISPVPNSAAAPPPTASSTTTSAPSTTTTTAPPPTTATSAPPVLAGGGEPAPPPSTAPTPPTSAEPAKDSGDLTAAGPHSATGGDLDLAAVALVVALVAVGVFGAWTLIRVRPGRI